MSPRFSRRRFLRDSAGVAAGAAATLSFGGLLAPRAVGADPRSVAIFGAGVAGLSAAHEVAERGFDVTVLKCTSPWAVVARQADIRRNPCDTERVLRRVKPTWDASKPPLSHS